MSKRFINFKYHEVDGVKTRSKKNKAIKLQNYVSEMLRNAFGFSELDVKPAIMGEGGVDIHLSSEALKVFPFSVECKNQERWNLPQFWKQAVENTLEGTMPLLVIKKNRHEALAVLRFEDLLKVVKDGVRTNNKQGG